MYDMLTYTSCQVPNKGLVIVPALLFHFLQMIVFAIIASRWKGITDSVNNAELTNNDAVATKSSNNKNSVRKDDDVAADVDTTLLGEAATTAGVVGDDVASSSLEEVNIMMIRHRSGSSSTDTPPSSARATRDAADELKDRKNVASVVVSI